jgi:hypothetical protein
MSDHSTFLTGRRPHMYLPTLACQMQAPDVSVSWELGGGSRPPGSWSFRGLQTTGRTPPILWLYKRDVSIRCSVLGNPGGQASTILSLLPLPIAVLRVPQKNLSR